MKRTNIGLLFSFLVVAILSSAQKDNGKWIMLFDGKSLKGWKQVTGTATLK